MKRKVRFSKFVVPSRLSSLRCFWNFPIHFLFSFAHRGPHQHTINLLRTHSGAAGRTEHKHCCHFLAENLWLNVLRFCGVEGNLGASLASLSISIVLMRRFSGRFMVWECPVPFRWICCSLAFSIFKMTEEEQSQLLAKSKRWLLHIIIIFWVTWVFIYLLFSRVSINPNPYP